MALLANGHVVELVAVGRNAEQLAVAGRVLDGCAATPAPGDAPCDAVVTEFAA